MTRAHRHRVINEHYVDLGVLIYSRNWTRSNYISRSSWFDSHDGNSSVLLLDDDLLSEYRESESWTTQEINSRSWALGHCRNTRKVVALDEVHWAY
jgi:hypothetical protein